MNTRSRHSRFILVLTLMLATAGFARAADPLNGSYTVGGFLADFETLASLCDYLNTNGVSGPVAINIRPGEYPDPISLHSVQGTSAINTITFQPAGDSLAVMIKSIVPDLIFGPYAVWLDNTSNVIIRDLNIMNLGIGPAVIRVENGSSNLKIYYNNIYGRPSNEDPGHYGDHGVLFTGTQTQSNILIHGNNISRVSNGIGAPLDGHLVNLRISNNYITDYASFGMYLQGLNENTKVVNNRIHFSQAFNQARGAEIRNTQSGFEFSGNQITGDFGYGAFFDFLGSRGSPVNYIVNNMIVGGSNANIGLDVSHSYNTHVMYNSVTIGSSEPATYAAGFDDDSLTSVVNNIFVANAGRPLGLYQFFFPQDFHNTIDYNDYYTKGDFFFAGPKSPDLVSTLAEWRDKTPWDDHSLTIDPEFISPTDLHTNNPSLDGLAIAVAYPLNDIDKDVRSSSPDIGADESVLLTADVAAYSIITNNICGAPGEVFVRFRNYSSNTLTSLTIKWSVNGVAQTQKAWTGNLLKGQVSDAASLGTFNFVGGTAYTIQVQTQDPNGTPDLNTANDTKTVNDIFSAVSGTYTIGAGGNFTTIQQAIDVLNAHGVCGPTTFSIKDGTYTGHYVLKQIPGASASSRVTFQSQSRDQSKVILTYNASTLEDDYVLTLDGTDFFTLRDVTIKTTNVGYATSIYYTGVVENIMIDHCYFTAPAVTAKELVRCDAAYLSGSSFKFNKFEGGVGAIMSLSDGTLFSDIPKPDSVYYNEFINQSHQGFMIESPGSKLVEGNKVHSNVGDVGFSGFVVQGNGNTITRNIVESRSVGIQVYGCGNVVSNNFVTMTDQQQFGGSVGLYVFACLQTQVVYNNVLSKDPHVDSQAALLFGSVAENTIIRNNNFIVAGPGTPMALPGLEGLLVSDYNNLVTAGNRFVRTNEEDFATLAAWQATMQDVHSISVDPHFVSDTDLHIQNNYLTGRGKNVPGITKDIDGDTRHPQYPTIGADEFGVPMLNDIAYVDHDNGFLCDKTKPIKVTFRNNGLLPITSFKIGWKKNGVSQVDKLFAGTLQPDQQTIIELSRSLFDNNIAYTLEITSKEVNGTTDDGPTNDDATISFKLYSDAALGDDVAVCEDDEVVLDAGAGYDSYTWSDGSHNQTIEPLESGSYSVTVKDMNQCSSQDQVEVTIFSTVPSITAVDGKNVVCEGSTNSLTVTPGGEDFEFEWRLDDDVIPGAGTSTIVIDHAGTYTVSVALEGCEFTSDPLLIKHSETPSKPAIVATGPIEFCDGGSVKLSAPPDFAGYVWSNGGTTKDEVITASGDLFVIVVNADGCTSAASEIVNVNVLPLPAKPSITVVGSLEFCVGGSVQLKAPAGFVAYKWSNNATSQNIDVSQSGSYTVKVTGSNGCESLSSTNVTALVSPVPEVEITVDNDKLTASGGDTYKWFLNNVEVPNETSNTLKPSQSGTYHVIGFKGTCSASSDDLVYTVNGLFDSGDWRVYPNPSSGKMTIAGIGVNGNMAITLEDGVGRLFRPVVVSTSSDQVSMDVSDMSAGIYLLKVDTGVTIIRSKIVIVR